MIEKAGVATGHGQPAPALPLVSVVVTNFNYARFIEECLRSIAGQTYPHIEVVIVDDVSTDNSVDVIRKFIATEPRAKSFQLVLQSENGGQMAGFIAGAERTGGMFITFVDADDYLLPDFVEKHVAAHLNGRVSAAVSCSNENQIDGDGRIITTTMDNWRYPDASGLRLTGRVPIRAMPVSSKTGGDCAVVHAHYVAPHADPTRGWIWSTTSAAMFRRSAISLALHDSVRTMRISADYHILHFSHLLGGTLLIHDALGCYRRHGNNNFARLGTVGQGSQMSISNCAEFDRFVLNALVARFPEILEVCGLRGYKIVAAFAGFRTLRQVYRASPKASMVNLARLALLIAATRTRRFLANLRAKLHALLALN